MAEESPLSATGALTEAQYERLAHPQAAEGLIGHPSDPAPVTVSGGQVIVRAGLSAILRGFPWSSGAAPLVFTPSLTGSPRVDLLTLRLFRDDAYRCGLVLRTGTGETPPTPYSGVGATDWYELPIAEIRMSGGALSVQRVRAWYLGEDGQILCTSTNRPPNQPGRHVWEVDTGRAYVGNGTVWGLILDDSGVTALTMASGWTASRNVLYRRNGWAFCGLTLRKTSGSIAADTSYTIATIPNGFGPVATFDNTATVVNTPINGSSTVTRTTIGLRLSDAVSSGTIVLSPMSWPVA